MHLFSLILADTISDSFKNIATLLAKPLPGIIMFCVVLFGYLIMSQFDDAQKGVRNKQIIGTIILGAIIVTVATSFGQDIWNNLIQP